MSRNHGYKVMFSSINTKEATLFVDTKVTAAEGSVDRSVLHCLDSLR